MAQVLLQSYSVLFSLGSSQLPILSDPGGSMSLVSSGTCTCVYIPIHRDMHIHMHN